MAPVSISVNIDIHRIRRRRGTRRRSGDRGRPVRTGRSTCPGPTGASAGGPGGVRPADRITAAPPPQPPPSPPAAYSPLPGTPFGGDPDRCPHRDEVTAHLLRCADQLDAEIRTVARLRDVRGAAGGSFTLLPKGRGELSVRGAVAASGAFGHPHRPAPRGLEDFAGAVLHAADYRAPEPCAGQRVRRRRQLRGADRRRAGRARPGHPRHAASGALHCSAHVGPGSALAAEANRGRHPAPGAALARTPDPVGHRRRPPPGCPHLRRSGPTSGVHGDRRRQSHLGRRRQRGGRHDPAGHRPPPRPRLPDPARRPRRTRPPTPPGGRYRPPIPASPTWGWSGSAACPRTSCGGVGRDASRIT